MSNYKTLDAWKVSMELVREIYLLTRQFPKEELYGLTSQIRRASSSIPTNISEGCGRNSDKEFNQFLNIALGSACETEYLLILSKDLKYIDIELFEHLEKEVNIIKSKIYNLKKALSDKL